VPAAAAAAEEAPAVRGLLLLLLAAVAGLKVRVVGVAARGDEVCVSRCLRATRPQVSSPYHKLMQTWASLTPFVNMRVSCRHPRMQ